MGIDENNCNYSFLQTSEETNSDGVAIVIYKSEVVTKPESKNISYQLYGENADYYGEILLKHNERDNKNEAELEYFSTYEHRKKGNISIGLGIVLDDAFSNYDLESIYLNIPQDNLASQRVAEKIGFKQREGSIQYFDITKKDFLKMSKSNKPTERNK